MKQNSLLIWRRHDPQEGTPDLSCIGTFEYFFHRCLNTFIITYKTPFISLAAYNMAAGCN